MTNTLNAVLARALETTGGYIEKGIDFVSEQTPDVLNQFLAWEFWSHAVGAGILLVVAIVSTIFCIRRFRSCVAKEWEDRRGNYLPGHIAGMMAFGTVALLCLGFSIENGYIAAKVHIAPKVYIIDKMLDISSK